MLRRLATRCLVIALLVAGATGCSRGDGPAEAVDAFLAGWSTGDLGGVAFLTPTGEALPAAQVAEGITALAGDLAEQPPQLATGEVSQTDGNADATFHVDWPLPGGATWSYASRVRLTEGDDGWQVIWEPAVVHPELVDRDVLRLRRVVPPRAAILDGAGDPLVTAQPVRAVGIWPSRVEDLASLTDALDGALRSLGHEIDMSDLPDRVEAATEDDLFVEVVTLREAEFEEIADQLADLPGITTNTGERQLAPSRTFARALLGTVGEVFAEDIAENPGAYVAGEVIGRGGLQERYERQLRGTVGYTVVIERPAPGDAVNDDIELDQVAPVPGTDLATTLDRSVQLAAEQALASESRPAALVAIRISDGAVLAVANTAGSQPHPVNLALTASVPPGSTLKLVSAYRLLDTGEVTLATPVACPSELTVDGFRIRNAFAGDRGDVPFQEAVAISCNTAFAGLAPRLGDDGLAEAGAALGLGGDWDLGIDTFTGSVPTGGSALDRAVAAFGQGQTQVSPAAMAAATAAVARGAWLPPTLVVDPAAPPAQPVPLPEQVVADLQTALRAVVTDGTGSALRAVPGGDVHGKTGTAEAGPEVTHGWFVGWQRDLAIAIFVEDGRSGSGAAVPLAEEFLRTLAD
jgi:cell division protein FtsI/penicillin-binding protein 2